jgi:hypothetical protein
MHRNFLFPLASLIALSTVASGCADRQVPETEVEPRVLYGFESCDDLLGYAKSNASDIIEQYGNPWGHGFDGGGVIVEDGAGESGGEGGTGDPAARTTAATTSRRPTCKRSASTSPT